MEIKVRVRAGARRETCEILGPHELRISVREKAKGNVANRRIVELVALHFKVPKQKVRILRGHRAHTKTLLVG